MKNAPTTVVVVCVTVIALAGVAAATLVDADRLAPVLQFLGTVLAGLLLLAKVQGVQNDVQEVKSSINGRLDAHADAARQGAKEAGVEAAKETLRQVVAIETAAAKEAKGTARHPAAGAIRKNTP